MAFYDDRVSDHVFFAEAGPPSGKRGESIGL